jgi:hypothetical protein
MTGRHSDVQRLRGVGNGHSPASGSDIRRAPVTAVVVVTAVALCRRMRASVDGPGGRGTGGGVARGSTCRGRACRGGARDESASELSEQSGKADGDQAECGGAAVAGALPGGCRNAAQVTIYNCRISVRDLETHKVPDQPASSVRAVEGGLGQVQESVPCPVGDAGVALVHRATERPSRSITVLDEGREVPEEWPTSGQ